MAASDSVAAFHVQFEETCLLQRLRERDILDCLNEQERRCWVPWAIGGFDAAFVAYRTGLTPKQVRRVLASAQRKLQKFVRCERLRWEDADEDMAAGGGNDGGADRADGDAVGGGQAATDGGPV